MTDATPNTAFPDRWRRRLLATLAGLAWLCAAHAQPTDTDQALDDARQQIDAIQKAIKNPTGLDDADLGALRARGIAAQAEANSVATTLAPQLASTNARIAELGTPTAGAKEDPDIASQRASLTKSFQDLDGDIKLSRLLAIEADQAVAQVAALRRSQFQARLGERTKSVLSPAFWSEIADDLPRDGQRVLTLAGGYTQTLQSAPAGAWWSAIATWALAGLALWRLHRWAMDWLMHAAPDGRLRRSLYALMRVTFWTAAFGVAAAGVYLVLGRAHTLPDDARQLLMGAIGMLVFGGFQFGLAEAMFSVKRPSWRLLSMPDEVAATLRWFPLQITLVSLPSWFADRLAAQVNASLAITVAVNCIVALAVGLTVAFALMRAQLASHREQGKEGSRARPMWQLVALGLNRLVLTVAVVSLLSGYVAFGSFAIRQLVWVAIVLGASYLLSAVIDDLLMAWVKRNAEAELAAAGDKAVSSSTGSIYAQAAVLASGALRLALLLFAVTLLFTPSGESPSELWRSTTQWQQGFDVGEFSLRPAATLRALVVLFAGLAAVRGLRNWLTARYLPSTSLDAGMRVSTATLFGYAGSVAVVAMAMSALGIGLERIAWVASALSVGIGFGLQAVVQNFVSGLILLAERPVKVGDWVSLGGIEGDIRRINVRATEIQMGDHSTVIVPNSEFITKVVRNVTLADPLGLVQVKLPVPIETDALQVRDILLAAFAAEPDILDSPEPAVLLDAINDDQLLFIATGYVRTPRISGKVRSAVLFSVLSRLADAHIALARAPTMLLSMPGGEPGQVKAPPAA